MPIPFFGELGNVNPVVVLPFRARGEDGHRVRRVADDGGRAVLTNPGLMFVPENDELRKALVEAVEGPLAGRCWPSGSGTATWAGWSGSASCRSWPRVRRGRGVAVTPKVFTTDLDSFAEKLPGIGEEHFGPASIVVTYREISDLPAVLERLDGSLTATVHATDPGEASEVVEVLGRRAGRLIWNGWPTGVAVCWAMHHGGPWPASDGGRAHVGRRDGHRPVAGADGVPGLAGGAASGGAQERQPAECSAPGKWCAGTLGALGGTDAGTRLGIRWWWGASSGLVRCPVWCGVRGWWGAVPGLVWCPGVVGCGARSGVVSGGGVVRCPVWCGVRGWCGAARLPVWCGVRERWGAALGLGESPGAEERVFKRFV